MLCNVILVDLGQKNDIQKRGRNIVTLRLVVCVCCVFVFN